MKYLLIATALAGIFSLGQIKLNTEKSTMQVTGTSSLHDWEMDVNEFDVKGTITDSQVQNLEVTVIAKSMKSGKSIMDSKAYDAVQADDFPEIKFTARSLQINGAAISGKASLEIAGNAQEVDFSAKIISKTGNEMRLQGQVPLKMTDFNIDPPTAMFGTLKTGDEVTIIYDISITQ